MIHRTVLPARCEHSIRIGNQFDQPAMVGVRHPEALLVTKSQVVGPGEQTVRNHPLRFRSRCPDTPQHISPRIAHPQSAPFFADHFELTVQLIQQGRREIAAGPARYLTAADSCWLLLGDQQIFTPMQAQIDRVIHQSGSFTRIPPQQIPLERQVINISGCVQEHLSCISGNMSRPRFLPRAVIGPEAKRQAGQKQDQEQQG